MHFWNTYCCVIQLGDSAFVAVRLGPLLRFGTCGAVKNCSTEHSVENSQKLHSLHPIGFIEPYVFAPCPLLKPEEHWMVNEQATAPHRPSFMRVAFALLCLHAAAAEATRWSAVVTLDGGEAVRVAAQEASRGLTLAPGRACLLATFSSAWVLRCNPSTAPYPRRSTQRRVPVPARLASSHPSLRLGSQVRGAACGTVQSAPAHAF